METRHPEDESTVVGGRLQDRVCPPSSVTAIRPKHENAASGTERVLKQETVDTETEAGDTYEILLCPVPAAAPCSSGERVSSEPGGPNNKSLVPCLHVISSGSQSMTAELAEASEVPCREETPPASMSSMNPLDQGNKACRSEDVSDTQTNESCHREETLIQDILKDNIKTEDASEESDMEYFYCLKHPTSDQSPSTAEDSEEEDSHDDGPDGGRDLASPRTEVWQGNSALILKEEEEEEGASTVPAGAYGKSLKQNMTDTVSESDIEILLNDDECEDVLGAAAPNLQPLQQSDGVCRPTQRLCLQHSTDVDQEQDQDFCRICHSSECSPDNLLLSPCRCSGSLRFIHVDCLQTWLRTRVESGLRFCSVRKCELCLGELNLDNSRLRFSDFYKPQSRAFGFLEESFTLVSWEMWFNLHPTPIIFPGFPRRAVRRSRRRRRERRSSTPYSPPLTRSYSTPQ